MGPSSGLAGPDPRTTAAQLTLLALSHRMSWLQGSHHLSQSSSEVPPSTPLPWRETRRREMGSSNGAGGGEGWDSGDGCGEAAGSRDRSDCG